MLFPERCYGALRKVPPGRARIAKTKEIGKPRSEHSDGLRAFFRDSNAGILLVGEAQPLVHPGICWIVSDGFHLRVPSGCMAVWARGMRMVVGCLAALVD
jgi:hypothetical protein